MAFERSPHTLKGVNRPSHAVSSLLLVASALILTACGGLFTSETGSGDGGARDGLRFSTLNPTTATPGSTVELAYDVVSASTGESNSDVNIDLSADAGATVNPTTTVVRIPSTNEAATGIVRVQIPAGPTPGAAINVSAVRDSSVPGLTIRPVTYRLMVATAGFTASLAPATVTGPQGGNAVGTLTLTPVGGFSGNIEVTGLDPDIVVTPSTVNIPGGQTTPVTTQVTYRIPASAPVGEPILAVVRAVSGTRRAIASYTVTPTSNQGQGSFSLGVTPQQVFISGGQATSAITVTLTPINGFQGDVTINVSLPGQGSLTVAPPTTNPFTMTIDGGPVTRTFQLRYEPVQGGGAPIGTASVQATGNGINRTANFEVGAS